MSESSEDNPTSPGGNGAGKRKGLGGPSTPEGKAISKFNATTHGIFSSVVVLNGESRAAYDALLNEMLKDLQPQGRFEEILVEKLTMLLWRHRRLLVSEGSEITKTHQTLLWEKEKPLKEAVSQIAGSPIVRAGIFWDISDNKALDQCIELIVRLRDTIESDGFVSEYDEPILKTIYGSNVMVDGRGPLANSYASWRDQALEAEDPTLRKRGTTPPEICQKNMLQEIDREIERLKQIRERHAAIESRRRKVEILRQRVPDGPQLERLLRYEASLERAFDRTLAQLERTQRIRLGHPVPPRLEVSVT